jgi:hypothetical protein
LDARIVTDDTLQAIGQNLSQLEKSLLKEYARVKAEAPSDLRYIVLPREQAQEHLVTLNTLHKQLMGTANSRKLELVTDLHDELRIRMIVLRDLLEREIPIPYLERALGELRVPQPSGLPPKRVPAPESASGGEEDEGWLKRLLASLPLLGALLRKKPAGAVSRRTVQPAPTSSADVEEMEQAQLPVEVMRTMGLHYLMEEDRLKLLKSGRELPRITHGYNLPPQFSLFVARDLSEAHFATRAYPKIARTPEELRRKLSDKFD